MGRGVLEPWFAHTDRDGTGHTAWFSDAPSLQPLLREARTAGLAGIALWRLGLEDPATWAVLGRRARNAGRSTAAAVVSVDPIRRASGEVASIPQSSQEGRRVFTWDPAGEQVVAERCLSLPRPEEVLEVSNVPSSLLFGSWGANAPREKGNFDVNMYASSPDIDPQETVAQRFACANIPRPVWLYNRSNIDAYRFTVGGYKDNGWDNFAWNTEDWFVSKK